ncbi:uncharacterized protein TNCT_274951 [Trichonephila clavata]|uniref:Uncharacterized protein n=1 Tax=Trichonephila clavata TaxID=2740835 RepID=A0A8X6KF64_TRICU|nr:uncharacterized protein TNCT_274951 [Trichonephila clavata]
MNEWKCDFNGSDPSFMYSRDYTDYSKVLKFNESGLIVDDLPFIKWEELIARKVSNLALSNCMKEKLTHLIRSLSLEIDRWNRDHSDILIRTSMDFQSYFCWTSEGLIDRKKTAISLLASDRLSTRECFVLACNYWFVNDVFHLRSNLSDADMYYITNYSNNTIEKAWLEELRNASIMHWSRLAKLSMRYHLNLRAYFQLLPRQQKVRYLKSFIQFRIIEYDDLYFCLSQVRPIDREYLFKKFSSQFLEYFLEFPLQKHFSPVSSYIWPFMSPTDYIRILNVIHQKIIIGWKDFNYVQLLKEFWQQSPLIFKESVKKKSMYQTLMSIIHSEENSQFESERLLEDYDGEHLVIQRLGMKYTVFKIPIHEPVPPPPPPPQSESIIVSLRRIFCAALKFFFRFGCGILSGQM